MKKKILFFLILIMAVVTFTSCKKQSPTNTNKPTNGESANSNQLQLLRTDIKLTQDQLLSRIKAEHIKENNGYIDSDEIVALITLPDEPLIYTFNNTTTYEKSVADYARTTKGRKQSQLITAKQNNLIDELIEKGLINTVEYQYSTIINAISVKTTYGNFKKIEKLTNIEQAIIAETYNLPKAIDKDNVSSITNAVEVYETGIFDSSSVKFDGEGTAVAVLDSGFDCSHSVFQNQPNYPMITPQDVSDILDLTLAKGFTKDLEVSDVYYSKKIPFVYDYADKDSDVFPYDSEHGTHVAGIIGGQDDVITGVAVNTQLVLLKVFSDLQQGAETDDILAALEDAVLIGVDAINMSLGSSCGFSREKDGDATNRVYDMIEASGISLITAASNDHSAGYGGAQGNTSFVTNPDNGTVGSPSTYPTSLSVASISGVKSKYMLANDSQILFFKESNSITGKENDFFKELGLEPGETRTYEYVTVPGVGLKVNYSNIDVKGKIALVRRGDNTFEEKALNAKNNGAIACIIYNNVEGDILMSMGKTDHIPTISISKDDGVILAQKDSGTMTVSYNNQAGPFMSDFSSWGPTPSLQLKPEITAHGGNIKSSVPGGGYDELSGTSMASPNLCGIVVLIKQYLKETYPNLSTKEISILTNQLLMSTANIVINEEGNPYSPRKQGAGVASLFNAVNTKAYLTVDGMDRPKLELKDDPKRTGVYTMEFNVVNLSQENLTYNLSLVGMTESVSTSDSKFVAEKSSILNGTPKFEVISGGTQNGDKVTVNAGETAKIKVVYTLTDEDKNALDENFKYGMYVEGFVKLKAEKDSEINLNIPFLAFYGDWTEAPLFDKTYYEVESEAHNAAIDEEDKIKADYYATTPYGTYFYNYIIPFGTYLYKIDESKYDAIPASKEHIAISNYYGSIDGIYSVYAGLLRNAKTMRYTITDKVTGEVVYDYTAYNARKAHPNGGTPIPSFEDLRVKMAELQLINNRQYEFKMAGLLDYGDGGATTNVRNTFEFDFYLDDEAPIIKDVSYEKVYDKTLEKDRYYLTMTVYDNHYVQSIQPIIFNSSSKYTYLADNPIPVYGERGSNTKVRFEITEYLDEIMNGKLTTSSLGFVIDDYALNSNLYLCQLPGTRGEFKFTSDGTLDGSDLVILSVEEGEVVDLTKYLSTSDATVDENKDYLKYLSWTSSDDNIAKVQEGQLVGKANGRVTITVRETITGKQAILIVNVKKKAEVAKAAVTQDAVYASDAKIKSIRFSYFDTIFAHAKAAQTSQIGSTGDREYLISEPNLSFYPGEQIKLSYDFDPWYAEDKYELTYESTNPRVATVDQNGVVTGLKKGRTTITLNVKGSNLKAVLPIEIKSEFVIENRTLVAYKGLGGDVVIPNDEGILYIGAYAFCLYEIDKTIEITDRNYDANKIPSVNRTVTSVVIPEGVEDVQKYAFYNCTGLEKVVLPESIKYVRELAFYKDAKLKDINLEKVQVIGHHAFMGCESLETIKLDKIYAIGASAFEGCKKLKSADLSTLRNTGEKAFKDCTTLKEVVLNENTKLSKEMFVNCGLETVDIYERVVIPELCFAECKNLKTVNIHNDLYAIGKGAFSKCLVLNTFNMMGTVEVMSEQLFYGSINLKKIVLPNSEVRIGDNCFLDCESLEEIEFRANTYIHAIDGSVFEGTKLSKFVVANDNNYYSTNGNFLLSKDGTKLIFAAIANDYADLVIDASIKEISASAFSGATINSLTINSDLVIGDYAFANCANLTRIDIKEGAKVTIGNHSFRYAQSLVEVVNLSTVKEVGDYAFADTGLEEVVVGENATYGEGAFFNSSVSVITIGKNTSLGFGAFQGCANLVTVNMPEEGGVHFGKACFANATKLSTIDLTKLDEIIEEETFYGCTSLKTANLTNTKEIGEYAFADCSSLDDVNIPVVEKIGEGAFGKAAEKGVAPKISSITLPNTLTTLGDGAFLGCQSLVEVTIPSSVTTYGDYLFAFCTRLEKVVLPENMKSIGSYSFSGCKVLKDINLDNVEEIGEYAFANCVALENVNIDNVKTIGDYGFASAPLVGDLVLNRLENLGEGAFQSTNISTFYAPNLKEIGEGAFQSNQNLTEFTFSSKLKNIGKLAFDDCAILERFNFIKDGQKVNDGKINDYAFLDNGILYTIIGQNKYELEALPAALDIKTLEVLENTIRIEEAAGNENKNITKIIFPDTLKLIGNYAFYGYDNLIEVEFKSINAPALEDYYDDTVDLTPTDPGYAKLHPYVDLFGLEFYYFNFIDLVGKKEPIKMVLPSNPDIKGYDSLLYEVYFGKLEDAERSSYVAMENNMIKFLEYAKRILNISKITLSSEELVTNAVTALNGIKQNPTTYGYSDEEWNSYVTIVKQASEKIAQLKFENASKKVHDLQTEINNLPENFDASLLDQLKVLSEDLKNLKFEERNLMDLTKYNQIIASYNEYVKGIEIEVQPIISTFNNSFAFVGALVSTTSLLALAYVLIKRLYMWR